MVRRLFAFIDTRSYFFVKLIRAIITAFLILVISFLMIRSSGNPAQIYLGEEAMPEAVEYFNKKWGLDKPISIQFVSYFSRAIKGDFGHSLIKSRPVYQIIMDRLPATLSLMIPAAIISIVFGVFLGMTASAHRKKMTDTGILVASTLGFSLPNFFFGVLLIFFFSIVLGWLPASGNNTISHYIMPLIAIVTADLAIFTRFSRAAFIDIYEQHYITGFRSLGVRESRIFFFQALPNAANALLTIGGFYIGSLVSGAIVTETIFAWPGLGSLLISSVKARDFPLVQGLILLFGISIVVANLAIDFLYGILDPRIRKGATT